LGDYIVKLYDLPEGNKIEGVLQVLGSFGIELAEQARSVELTESLDLLNCTNLVIKTRRVINTSEPFGFELFFEARLFLALV
jgi:hypothetical protein